MATLQITQIPTETTVYTGANTYDELVPTNYWQILPVTVNITDNLSSYYKVKYILRVYAGTDATGTLLATIKQRTNNASTTTNQVAIFDIRGIINTQLQITYSDAGGSGKEIHQLGKNVTTKILSYNNLSVKTVFMKATWERSETATGTPVEQTGGTDEVTMIMYFTPATFSLFSVKTTDDNPLANYNTSANTDYLMSNAPSIYDYRKLNREAGGGDLLSGHINYISKTTDFHTIGFQNKSGWGSDGNFLGLQFYESDGTKIVEYAFPNDGDRGGIAPASASTDGSYLLYAGCGSANFENYVGQAHKNASGSLTTFDGQPSGGVSRNYAYYRVFMCDTSNPAVSIRSKYYYFVRDFDTDTNCKDQDIIRLGWMNELGAWDYYDFRGGQVETVDVERTNYSTILGAGDLDRDIFTFDTWGAGKRTLVTSSTLKSTLQTQFIQQAEGQFLETLFSSSVVMVIEKGNTTVSQSVVISNKSFQRKTSAKNKLQIQYTFEIEYSNALNTNS